MGLTKECAVELCKTLMASVLWGGGHLVHGEKMNDINAPFRGWRTRQDSNL
jgi:hypothetical protein